MQLARSINALLAVIEQLQSLQPGDRNPALADAKLEELAKYKVFENIISISNTSVEDASSSSDFSQASIRRRMETGYRDAARVLWQSRRRPATALKMALSEQA